MKTDLEGRIDNLSIGGKHILQALFEAVSNALHAVQAGQCAEGCIKIELLRDPEQRELSAAGTPDSELVQPHITSIRVLDNGEGFTPENFESFDTLDSRRKVSLGGKGVGRLIWLKFFERGSIDSHFRPSADATTLERRTFEFQLPKGVIDHGVHRPVAQESGTEVILHNLRPKYARFMRQKASTIRNQILNQFLAYLFTTDAPLIELVDGEERLTITRDDLPEHERGEIKIGSHVFEIYHVKARSPDERQHKIYYCAVGRVVMAERVKVLPGSRFRDAGGDFYYHSYVSSPYLNQNVNQERTAFALDEDEYFDSVGLTELRAAIEQSALDYLEPYLEGLRAERDKKLDRILTDRFPEYLYVREHNRTEIETIPLDAKETDIEDAVATIHFRNQKSGRELLHSVVNEVKRQSKFDAQSFIDKHEDDLERIMRINQASLVTYVLYRKSIIDIFEEVLKKTDDQFQRESAVHELIFPMGREHESGKAFVDHNLWLIDERLTYASYLASDRPLSEHKILFGVDDPGEPDIAAYYNLGFSANRADEELYNAVIVEFKRPGPLKKRDEDPHQQVIRYIDRIRAGFYAEEGAHIKASENTRFYCYIVCDLDSDVVKQMLKFYQYKPICGGEEGYFLPHDDLRAYFEIVPFKKIVRSAKRNHRAFFERAGLSPVFGS